MFGAGWVDTKFVHAVRPRRWVYSVSVLSNTASRMLQSEQDTQSQASTPIANMPKPLVFTVLVSFCTLYTAYERFEGSGKKFAVASIFQMQPCNSCGSYGIFLSFVS